MAKFTESKIDDAGVIDGIVAAIARILKRLTNVWRRTAPAETTGSADKPNTRNSDAPILSPDKTGIVMPVNNSNALSGAGNQEGVDPDEAVLGPSSRKSGGKKTSRKPKQYSIHLYPDQKEFLENERTRIEVYSDKHIKRSAVARGLVEGLRQSNIDILALGAEDEKAITEVIKVLLSNGAKSNPVQCCESTGKKKLAVLSDSSAV